MDIFNNLYKSKRNKPIIIGSVLGALAILLLVFSFLGFGNSDEVTITWAEGPFATYDDGSEVINFYLAEAVGTYDEVPYPIIAAKEGKLPVITEDMSDEEFEQLLRKPTTIKGVWKDDLDLSPYISYYFEGTDMEDADYSALFGYRYLDTTELPFNLSMLIPGILLLVIFIIVVVSNLKAEKKTKEWFNSLENESLIEKCREDFSAGDVTLYKKRNLALSHNYVVDVSNPTPIIIDRNNIKNAYVSRLDNGKLLGKYYIVVETEDTIYRLAPIDTNIKNKNASLELADKIKERA